MYKRQIIDGTRNGGSGGGGAGLSPNTGSTAGAAAGPLGEVTTNNIVYDLQITKKGGDGSDFNSAGPRGGHGGGAGGTASNSAVWALDGVNPLGKTSGIQLWNKLTLHWAKGGSGARSDAPGGNSSGGVNERYIGHGGAGSHDAPYHSMDHGSVVQGHRVPQHGHIGGAIINVPAGISISITSSNNNMVTENDIVNGRTSYMFYDNRFQITTGENSGSFTIVFLRT